MNHLNGNGEPCIHMEHLTLFDKLIKYSNINIKYQNSEFLSVYLGY